MRRLRSFAFLTLILVAALFVIGSDSLMPTHVAYSQTDSAYSSNFVPAGYTGDPCVDPIPSNTAPPSDQFVPTSIIPWLVNDPGQTHPRMVSRIGAATPSTSAAGSTLVINALGCGPAPGPTLDIAAAGVYVTGPNAAYVNIQANVTPAPPTQLTVGGTPVNVQATCQSVGVVNQQTGQTEYRAGTYIAYVWIQADYPNPQSYYVYEAQCQVTAPTLSTSQTPGTALIIQQDTPATRNVTDDEFNGAGVSDNILQINNTGDGDLTYQVSLAMNDGEIPNGLTLTSPATGTISGVIGGGTPTPADVVVQCGGGGVVWTGDNTIEGTLTIRTDEGNPLGTIGQNETTFSVQCPITSTPDYSATDGAGAALPDGGSINVTANIALDDLPIQGTPFRPASSVLQFFNLSAPGTANLQITNIRFDASQTVRFRPYVLVGGSTIDYLDPTDVLSVAPSTTAVGRDIFIECTPLAALPQGVNQQTLTNTMRLEHNANIPDNPTTEVTYQVSCDQGPSAPRPTVDPAFDGSAPGPTNPNFIEMGSVTVGGSTNLQIRIWNTGSGPLSVLAVSATDIDANNNDLNLQPNERNFNVTGSDPTPTVVQPSTPPGPPGENDTDRYYDLVVTCAPVLTPGVRYARVDVNYADVTDDQFFVRCVATDAAAPALTTSIDQAALTALAGSSATATVTLDNTGGSDVQVNTITLQANPGNIFSLGNQLTLPLTIAPTANPNPSFTVTCSPTQATSTTPVTGAVRITHSAPNSPLDLNISCARTTTAPPTAAIYSSNPSPGSAISMATSVGGSTPSSIVVTNTGAAGNLTITSLSFATGNQIGFTAEQQVNNAIVLGPGQQTTINFTCSSTAGGTYSDTLTVNYTGATGSPVRYNVTCTVGAQTATPIAPTALPPVQAGEVTQCVENTILTTPFPQNASGEFLFVNCFTITTARTVNISLTQVLTNLATDTTEQEIQTIRTNPALVSFWRMGSWFLVDSSYDPATQNYTFQSASGTNIYGAFFGAITRPVGQQSNAAFAGTTTGNVEDAAEVVIEEETNRAALAMLIATLVVLIVGAVFVSRRQVVASSDS